MEDLDIEAIAQAFEQLRVYCEEAWQAFVDAIQPLIDLMSHTWHDLCRLHLIPRQYRDTIARRKIQRYYAFVQLRM